VGEIERPDSRKGRENHPPTIHIKRTKRTERKDVKMLLARSLGENGKKSKQGPRSRNWRKLGGARTPVQCSAKREKTEGDHVQAVCHGEWGRHRHEKEKMGRRDRRQNRALPQESLRILECRASTCSNGKKAWEVADRGFPGGGRKQRDRYAEGTGTQNLLGQGSTPRREMKYRKGAVEEGASYSNKIGSTRRGEEHPG